MEEILSGWLIKSPGDRFVTILGGKVQIPVKAKWRRRYFKLFKPAGVLPDLYKFNYYKDNTMQKKLGSINLENCERIQASLDTAFYQNLFAIQTTSKKNRLYYLAAETEEEMLQWVECLCKLCNLRHEVRQSDNNHPSANTSSSPDSAEELSNQREETAISSHRPRVSYTELSECTTGLPATSPISRGSSHDEQDEYDYDFPPSPTAVMPHPDTLTNGVTSPTPHPRRPTLFRQPNAESQHFSSSIDESSSISSSANQSESCIHSPTDTSIVSPADPTETTKVPLSEPEITTNETFPPPRPPKLAPNVPSSDDEDIYANEEVFTNADKEACRVIDSHYDVPRSLLTAPPPACIGPSTKIHKYSNASPRLVHDETDQEHTASNTRHELDQHVKPARDGKGSGYIPMNIHPSNSYILMDHLTDQSQDIYDIPSTARPDSAGDIYDIAPPATPVTTNRPESSQDIYDTLPPATLVTTNRPDSTQDIYDTLPPATLVTTNRPDSTQDIYDTLPPATLVTTNRPDSTQDIYDTLPPATLVTTNRPDSTQDIYDILPSATPVTTNRPDSAQDIYDIAPPATPVTTNRPVSAQDIYDVVPSASPRPVAKVRQSIKTVAGVPHRPPKPQVLGNSGSRKVPDTSEEQLVNISQSHRTRSYIRDSVFSDGEPDLFASLGKTSLGKSGEIQLPVRVGADSSSDEELSDTDTDDELYDVPPSRNPVPIAPARPVKYTSTSSGQKSGPVTAPPVATPRVTTAIQYVELDEAVSYSSHPIRSPAIPSADSSSGNKTDLEYVCLDKLKTQGLMVTMNERTSMREEANQE